jgi:hypothetical protein
MALKALHLLARLDHWLPAKLIAFSKTILLMSKMHSPFLDTLIEVTDGNGDRHWPQTNSQDPAPGNNDIVESSIVGSNQMVDGT